MSIAPKPRAKPIPKTLPATAPKSTPNQTIRDSLGCSQHKNLRQKLILRALPTNFYPKESDGTEVESAAFVSPGAFEMLTGEKFNFHNIQSSRSRPRFISVHRLRPPAPPPSSKQQKLDSSEARPLQSRLLHKGGSALKQDDNEQHQSSTGTIEVRYSKDVPDYNIALLGGENVEEWDLVRCAYILISNTYLLTLLHSVELLSHQEHEAHLRHLKNVQSDSLPAASS